MTEALRCEVGDKCNKLAPDQDCPFMKWRQDGLPLDEFPKSKNFKKPPFEGYSEAIVRTVKLLSEMTENLSDTDALQLRELYACSCINCCAKDTLAKKNAFDKLNFIKEK